MGRRGESLDVEALVAELEAEAVDLRRKLGPSSVEPLDAGPTPVEPSEDRPAREPLLLRNLSNSLERLRAIADPRGQGLRSHRSGAAAATALATKRLLIRLLTPIWDQQKTFNRAIVDDLGEIGEAVRSTSERADRRLQSIERRLLEIEDQLARSGETSTHPGFDYERFEAAFRGDPAVIKEKLRPYLPYFTEGPVLDLGCGDGAFLKLLCENGVEARGVDRSAGAVARANASGLSVAQGDLMHALDACPDQSLGGVAAIQVFEHLTLPALIGVLRAAKQKIRPGGVLLAETVNVSSLITFSRAWSIDPTHRQALHPLTLRFLVEDAGFEEAELLYSGDVEPEHRMTVQSGESVEARNAAILNELVFAPQDYAVVARA